ncbi:MAG: beta-xylosidase, partial [Methylobacterium sp.]
AQGNGVALVAKHSNQCLDVGGASTANGAGAIQWPCHGGLNQTFVGPQASW